MKTLSLFILFFISNAYSVEMPTIDQVKEKIQDKTSEVTDLNINKAVSQLILNYITASKAANGISISMTMTITIIKKFADNTYVAKHVRSGSNGSKTLFFVFNIVDKKMFLVKGYDGN
jgi:hypothetical protein